MTGSMHFVIGRLRTMDRLVLIAAVAGLAVLAYYGVLGMQFWDARARDLDLQGRVAALAGVPTADEATVAGLEVTAAEGAAILEEALGELTLAHTDEVVATVVARAETAGTQLITISTRPASPVSVDGLSLTGLAVSIRISGDIGQIQDFLDGLSQDAPGLHVRSAVLNGLPDAPWAQIELDFVFNPVVESGA